MCGVAGIVSSVPFNAGVICEMNDAISHRGPDDEGYVLFPDFCNKPVIAGGKDTLKECWNDSLRYLPKKNINGLRDLEIHVALANRRLSILDLSAAGHMPMCDPGMRFWITYNGGIYNYLEIREQLEKLG